MVVWEVRGGMNVLHSVYHRLCGKVNARQAGRLVLTLWARLVLCYTERERPSRNALAEGQHLFCSLSFYRFDFKLLGAVLMLTAIGLVMIHSAGRAQLPGEGQPHVPKAMLQSIWVVLGLILFVLVSSVHCSRLASVSRPAYLATLALLVLVLIVGGFVRAAQRWLSVGPINIQPAELAKLGLILMLAMVFASREGEPVEFELLIRSLGYALVPSALILLQPDLGTPILLLFVWGVVAYVAGARMGHLAAFFFVFIMLFVSAWGFGVIRPHQKERMLAFASASADARKERWQLEQSLIAIGSGHLTGQGLYRGGQSQLSFVPDQETDFIFSVVGEELGFLGATTVIVLFGLVLWRCLAICADARTFYAQLAAAGITAVFFLHIMANIGMTLGMMPIKGLPLPFVSYGGSSILVNFIALGILQSIYRDSQSAISFE